MFLRKPSGVGGTGADSRVGDEAADEDVEDDGEESVSGDAGGSVLR